MRRHWFSGLRRLVQLLSFFLLPGLFADSFRAFLNIAKLLASGRFSWQEASISIWILFATVPATILLGRFFCGFFCSFGAMQDLAFWLGLRIGKQKKIAAKWDSYGKPLKYGILLGCVVVSISGFFSLASISPWDVFGQLASLSGWQQLGNLSAVGFGLLCMIFAASTVIQRFFCRYLCPIGAVYGLLSLLSPMRIRRTDTGCRNCRLCEQKCEMGLNLKQADTVCSPDCISCQRCVQSCPRKALGLSKKSEGYAVFAVAVFALTIFGSRLGIQNTLPNGQNDILVRAGAGRYPDGVYEGSARGFRGETNVRVTVQDGYLQAIDVLSSDDDDAYLQIAKGVTGKILSAQSSNVDAVSGATMSSFGILRAVRNALPETAQSKGAAAVGNFPDGITQGTGAGFRGEIVVEVIVENGSIQNIRVISYYDDDAYFDPAMAFVIQNMVQTQKIDVDALSGATYSSEGIIKAAADALGVPEEELTLKGGPGLQAKHKNRGHKVQKFK